MGLIKPFEAHGSYRPLKMFFVGILVNVSSLLMLGPVGRLGADYFFRSAQQRIHISWPALIFREQQHC